MFTKEEIFMKAAEYDFDAVKEYLEQGGNPDIYDSTGGSLLTAILAAYYYHVFYSDPEEVQFLEEHEDDEEYHLHINKYCRMPLEERPHTVKEQIDYLMAKGIGVNAVGWKEAEEEQKTAPAVETPLFHSVIHRDYCMTKYLLECGADPCQKLFSDGDYDRIGYENWLPDQLDLYLFDGDQGDAGQNDLEIAALLMHYGLDKWGGGFCIDVDHKTRTIYGHSPHFIA